MFQIDDVRGAYTWFRLRGLRKRAQAIVNSLSFENAALPDNLVHNYSPYENVRLDHSFLGDIEFCRAGA